MTTAAVTSEISCPRCHRISFEWEHDCFCRECHWTIRPSKVEAPYGCDVLIELREANGTTRKEARHYKGHEGTARRRARMVPGCLRVLAVVPLSEEVWLRCYGEGRL